MIEPLLTLHISDIRFDLSQYEFFTRAPQNTEYRIQNTEYRIQNTEYRIQHVTSENI